jgi:hypothetical protein
MFTNRLSIRHLTRSRYLLSVAATATAVGLLSACGGGSHTGNMAQPSSAAPQSNSSQIQVSKDESSQSQAETEAVRSSREWGPGNCMHTYVISGSQTLSDTPTSLCRTAVTLDNQTYYLVFPKNASSNDWLEEYGTPGDGYTYWRYAGLPWLRQASSEGAEQILVQYSDGSTEYRTSNSGPRAAVTAS